MIHTLRFQLTFFKPALSGFPRLSSFANAFLKKLFRDVLLAWEALLAVEEGSTEKE
jgi:hypothetical protein